MISGVVKDVKQFNTKSGTAYTVVLDDDQWYGCGFKHPDVEAGDKVSFNYNVNGKYKNIDMDSFTKDGKAEAPPKDNNNSGGNQKNQYWQNKEERDIIREHNIKHQGCRNTAVEVAKFAHEQGFVKVPQKQADKLDAFLSLVDELTERFIQQSDDYATGNDTKTKEESQDSAEKTESSDEFE